MLRGADTLGLLELVLPGREGSQGPQGQLADTLGPLVHPALRDTQDHLQAGTRGRVDLLDLTDRLGTPGHSDTLGHKDLKGSKGQQTDTPDQKATQDTQDRFPLRHMT